MDNRHESHGYRHDPAVPEFADDKPVVIFDGMCVFCSGGARLLMRLDRGKRFRLLAAQTELGDALYRHFGLDPMDYQSFMVIDEGRAWLISDATLRVCKGLGLPWSALSLARFIPRRLRDSAYDVLARNRYSWFGKRETCLSPDISERDRFLTWSRRT